MSRQVTPENLPVAPVISDATPTNAPPSPQLPIRQSARKKKTISTPGFVPTQSDSRRALCQQSSNSRTADNSTRTARGENNNIPRSGHTSTTKSVIPSSSQETESLPQEIYDMTQNSDEENTKAKSRSLKSKADRKLASRKDGTNSVLVFFDQIETSLSYSCIWCPKLVKASTSSYYNLKIHQDGSNIKGTIRGACPGRSKAIAAGAKLPLTAAEQAEEAQATSETSKKPGSTVAAYVTKGRFDNNTFNKLLVFWLIRHSLPWACFEDAILRITFDYVDMCTKIYSRTWAATTAQNLYLALLSGVFDDIKNSNSKISLVSDIWTTKGGHKAFLGISVCYITKQWEYRCQHLAMKYISWHHKGKYLAIPFAQILIKNGLHDKISVMIFESQSRLQSIIKDLTFFLFIFCYILAKTTDSGSNNFTMTKEIAQIIGDHDGTFWDQAANHQRCFCHVLSLILGAGLAAINLSTAKGPATKKPESFPTLETITEEGEIIDDAHSEDGEDEEEVDPDDVSESNLDSQPESEEDDIHQPMPSKKNAKGKHSKSGIGFTLKKIDYVCRCICSSPAKQSEFKVWALKLGYDGPGIIGGYGIRWNIAYDSRNRAYNARKESYEFTSKEWENIKVLNRVLKGFLDLTKQMEGEGPSCTMVLYEYSRLIESLIQLKEDNSRGLLEAMFNPMIKKATKYQSLALTCEPILMATMLHPAWRLLLFSKKYPAHHTAAQSLLVKKFKEHQESLKPTTPPPTEEKSQPTTDPEEDGYNFFPTQTGVDNSEDELNRYHATNFLLGIKGNVLLWWKASIPAQSHSSGFVPSPGIPCQRLLGMCKQLGKRGANLFRSF
ncbi:hypothetical protein PTTG_25313 [Puccinia triticina 1-1 BBBD Race 1]|uniref:hAT-like transposase RNase-H fold domain-containing protein n=1 Tax=Puccinia triticina (isolate 1-1 / race 1 (BBBD)) TaxID=630390 RepID=A0A180H492_PUCT1|nr:hypothetical protein PTTG_25313 [Puccinia triticina 1-1 BBBD Race 1]